MFRKSTSGLVLVLLVTVIVLGQVQDDECVPNQTYLVPNSGCSQFRICDASRSLSASTIRYCSPGTLFNEGTGYCDHPMNVACASPRQAGGCVARIIPNTNCRNFTKCSEGVEYRFACPLSTMYSPTLEVCVWELSQDAPSPSLCNSSPFK